MLKEFIHYSMHLAVPGLLAYIFFRDRWKKAWGVMLATMLVDLDHLLANPIFDPDRCSVGFHPLHSGVAISVYCVLLAIPKSRIVAVGLLFHMLTDWQDCLW